MMLLLVVAATMLFQSYQVVAEVIDALGIKE